MIAGIELFLSGNAKGVVIGAATGAVHELFIVVRKKSREATINNVILSVIVSSFIGWVTYSLIANLGIDVGLVSFLVVIASLNSFVVIQFLTNLPLILEVFASLFPSIIDEKKAKKIKDILDKKNGVN